MKHIILFLLMLTMISVRAQVNEDTPITINVKDASLSKFCMAVHLATGYTFVYGQDVQLSSNINVDARNIPLKEVLEKALVPYGVKFIITDKHILLLNADTQRNNKLRKHTISGHIIDSSSLETLIGATVYDVESRQGTVSNAYGFFSITLPEGANAVSFSYMGYKTQTLALNLEADTVIEMRLITDNRIEEVRVEADRPQTGIASTRTGSVTIPVEIIKRTPSFLGEPDVLKTLQTLPGVQAGISGTCGIHVRGGGVDQNLYLLDGVPMYNVDHILGFISAFTPDAVKNVDFFKASFPSRYGGRLSSVVDVRTNDGDMNNYHGLFSIGTLSSHATFEGPIVKEKTSFLVSLRRSYADLFINPAIRLGESTKEWIRLNFYDINVKLNHKFSETDRIFGSFYFGRDVFGMKNKENSRFANSSSKSSFDSSIKWGNTLASFRWNHVFSPQTFSNLTLAYNRFNFHIGITTKEKEYENNKVVSISNFTNDYNSGINDYTVNMDFDYHPSSNHHIKYGGQYILHHYSPEINSVQSYEMNKDETSSGKISSHGQKSFGNELNFYADDDFNLSEKIQFNYGLRATLFATDGKAYPCIEPRVAMSYIINSKFRAKASYSMMHQFVHLLSSAPISLPTDLWVPVTKDIKPMVANQGNVGVYYKPNQFFDVSAELYYKNMRRILDYQDGVTQTGTSVDWQSHVASGRGRAYGLELMANFDARGNKASIGYTLGKSERKFDETINYGEWFPYQYDRRHSLIASYHRSLGQKVDVSAKWTYTSGAWATISKQVINYASVPANDYSETYLNDMDYYDSRNNYKLAPSHHLDIAVNFYRRLAHTNRTLSISIMNVYNRLNQDVVYTQRDTKVIGQVQTPEGNFVDEVRDYTSLNAMTLMPIFPSISYSIQF